MNERVGAAAVINRHFQNGETTCRQLSKRLPDNSTIFAAEATAISLALNYYQHMGPVHHDVVIYSDSMSCLQAIEGENTENPFIRHIMNLLWLLSDKSTHVRFCWIPSHCGIEGNERVDQLAKETLDQDIDRPTGKCPLYSYEAPGKLLHSEIGSNQVGCSCTWQRSLSRETNIRATKEIPAPNQSWRGCNHPTSNWPYKGHQIPYLVPRTADCLSPLWSTTDHWPYALGVCSVTGVSWGILHSCLVEYSLPNNSWDLHSGIPAGSEPSPSRCGSLLWLNVLFAGNWGWRHWEPFYLPYHEPALVIEWQGHTCSFLLGTKPLWHWRKWKSGSTSKRDPRPRYRPTGKCPLYRYETTGQLLHSEVGSNQVGCSCTWQRSLSCETNTGATEEVPAPNQGWRGCNHPTSNWPYQGHQIPYLVPRTTNWLSPLWWNTDHWPYAAGVCIVTGMSWWILHSRLIECSLRDNSWDLHNRIPARSGILLSDMM